MSGIELNKIAAAILLSSLIAMVVGTIANVLYKPKLVVEKRGYQLEVTEDDTSAGGAVKEEQVDIEQLMAKANVANGEKIAKKCISCHTFEKGGANKIGPNLWNVINAAKGHKSDFAYSKALLAKGGTWDHDSLYHLLRKPSKFIPGTKMSFAGLTKPEDIVDVMAFLKENGEK